MSIESANWGTLWLPLFQSDGRKTIYKILKECKQYRKFYRRGQKDYLLLALYMNYIEHSVIAYIPKGLVYRFHVAMNGQLYPDLSKDKTLTASRLLDHQVSCVHEFMSFDPARGFVGADGASCSVEQASDLIAEAGGRAFAKPVAGKSGTGARIVSADQEELQQLALGNQNIIFQPVVEQHPALASLNPASVNTVRINTLRTDDHVESHVASLRIGRQGQIVDNAAVGGMCVKIDMATGQLGRFARTKPQFSTRQLEQHPDTGVAFGSITIPFWQDVLELVQRGARAMTPLRSLGGTSQSRQTDQW